MRISVTNRFYLAVIFVVGLAIAINYNSYQTFTMAQSESYWIRHAYQVLNQVEYIQRMVREMEASRKGFRSTNERRFLQSYESGQLRITGVIEELKKLVSDNPAQFERAARIEAAVDNLLDYWRRLGYDASQYDRLDLIRIMDAEQQLMTSLQHRLDDIARAERIIAYNRERRSEYIIQQATNGLIIGTIFIILIVLTLVYFIYREFRIRRRAEKQLLQKLTELEAVTQVSQDKNWTLTGISSVNKQLQGATNLIDLTQSVLTALVQYLGVTAGAFYHAQGGHFARRATFAYPQDSPMILDRKFGLIGQAALEKSPMVVDSVPATFWKLHTGAGEARPGQLIYVPLWYGKELKGMIELVAFAPLASQHLTLLEKVADSIAISMNSVESREKVFNLLRQVREQKQTLEHQQEELRQTNDALVQQAEVLQASEEEMRVQEEELRQMNTELEMRNQAIESARQALDNKARELEMTSKFKSEFLANMSHELRTPLNSVLILAKLLSENKTSNLTEKQLEYTRIIHRSGSDLLDLINDVLDLSKIEAGKIEIHLDPVPIRAIAEDMQQLFQSVADQKGVSFVIRQTDNLPETIQTDRVRLEQIIRNLLSNAFKFTPRSGTVTLLIRRVDGGSEFDNERLKLARNVLAVTVEDTGIGIPADKQQLIFEAFQQADGSTSRKYGGTGLGLSICRELSQRLGGEIKLSSEEGQGSRFTLYLPLTDDMPAQPEKRLPEPPAAEPAPVVEPSPVNDDRQRIQPGDNVLLIIEDDPNFASIVQDFARDKQYKTLVALRGDDGLNDARAYRPTAIILDMNLPGIDGWSLLKLLKADETLRDVPVHIISGGEPRSSLNGAIAYVSKPVSKDDLEDAFRRIGHHLNGHPKKVLVLTGRHLTNQALDPLLDKRLSHVERVYVQSVEEAVEQLRQQPFDCLIIDLEQAEPEDVGIVNQLRDALPSEKIPVIIHLDKDLSTTDERALKKVSDVIIRESRLSKDRLLDELELFLYKVQQTRPPDPMPPMPVGSSGDLQGKRVLLVDDDMRNVFALSTLLEEQHMNVVTAGDGKEALEQLEQNPVDIVLMDVMMPEMDGYEATRRIRANPRFGSLPVIALTAKAMTGDREKCLEAGASDYITKPVDTGRLLSLMRVWLS